MPRKDHNCGWLSTGWVASDHEPAWMAAFAAMTNGVSDSISTERLKRHHRTTVMATQAPSTTSATQEFYKPDAAIPLNVGQPT